MSSDAYNEISLADAVKFIVDNRGKSAPTEKTGTALIATNCVSNENLYPEKLNLRYISQDTYDNWFRSHPEPGDILLTNKGSKNGAVCLVPDPVDFCIAQDMVALRADEEKIDPLYLFAALRSSLIQGRIKSLNVDAVIPHFKKTDFNKLFIPLPEREQQEYIGKCYFDLSNKIELNRQINQTLEQIAQTIFKSWFIDFEPVKAKIQAKQNGQDPERAAMRAISGKTDEELAQLTPGQRQQLTTTAALFPYELEDSEFGYIPKGWAVTNLGAVTSELRRGISPKYTEEGGIQVINQKCIRNHTVDFSLCRRNDPSKRKVDGRELRVGDVLVNSTGVGTLGRLAPLRYLPEDTVADSHVTVVRGSDGVVSPLFLAGLMLTKEVLIESSGAGSTGQTELRRQVLEEIVLCKPTYVVQKAFDEIVKPTHELIAQNELQQLSLPEARDALLPKLLSGDLTPVNNQVLA